MKADLTTFLLVYAIVGVIGALLHWYRAAADKQFLWTKILEEKPELRNLDTRSMEMVWTIGALVSCARYALLWPWEAALDVRGWIRRRQALARKLANNPEGKTIAELKLEVREERYQARKNQQQRK